jgi:tRNA-specific 2-thiouridylase
MNLYFKKRGSGMVLDLNSFNKYIEYNPENTKYTVAVGMSGGVDSSTVAYMLKKQGYNVIGITMKHWSGMDELSEDSNSKTCCSLDDIYDAKRVCDDINIPHYVINLKEPFKEKVVDYFIDEYEKGRTPNPCMVCNRYIKLGKLLEYGRKMGADFIATGHYAKIKNGNLYMGDDPKKDQVYFLSQVKRENLKYLMFPIGDLEKTQVRKIAENLGVRVYAKRDSQEICFIEDGKLQEFLIEMTDGRVEKEGEIVNKDGTVLGKHKGFAFYTIGQRKGLGVQHETPLYVLKLDSKKNRVIVGDNEDLFKTELFAEDVNVLSFDKIDDIDGLECHAKTRSRDILHLCKIEVIKKNLIKVKFLNDKVRAVTPGQGLVLYDFDGKVIASAFIK